MREEPRTIGEFIASGRIRGGFPVFIEIQTLEDSKGKKTIHPGRRYFVRSYSTEENYLNISYGDGNNQKVNLLHHINDQYIKYLTHIELEVLEMQKTREAATRAAIEIPRQPAYRK